MAKKEISKILIEKRNWHDANLEKPAVGQLVVIRFTDPDIIFSETDTEIWVSEDEKLGEYIPNASNPNTGVWIVSPPYPKFDYSPLCVRDQLNEGVYVTHWAIPEPGEIEGYKTRFDQIGIYKKLNIEADEEHLELVYRALLWGAAFIDKYGDPDDPDTKRLSNVLTDLQYVIDIGHGIDLTDEEYEKKIQERRELIEKLKQKAAEEQMKRVEAEIAKMEKERSGE